MYHYFREEILLLYLEERRTKIKIKRAYIQNLVAVLNALKNVTLAYSSDFIESPDSIEFSKFSNVIKLKLCTHYDGICWFLFLFFLLVVVFFFLWTWRYWDLFKGLTSSHIWFSIYMVGDWTPNIILKGLKYLPRVTHHVGQCSC